MSAAIKEKCATVARRVRVEGHVQGVGFRPFVKRLADELQLTGAVGNDASGVFIDIEGDRFRAHEFLRRLRTDAPQSAQIETVRIEEIGVIGRPQFDVFPSQVQGELAIAARVPRDRAVCAECLAECRDRCDRRFGYAFTACAVCGPRYSVLHRLPYDRSATSMATFALCPLCSGEFHGSDDRRFFAELTACPTCGPRVNFRRGDVQEHDESAVQAAADALRRGEIVALKGLGGYQLLVRADDPAAVARLRERKRRPSKPLAIMVRTLNEASAIAELNASERAALTCAENPIVLACKRLGQLLADNVAPGMKRVGLMLPTTPLHDVVLGLVDFPIVATSGNRGEEPILGDEATSEDLFALADAVVAHNRPIVRTIDDSVVHLIGDSIATVRLARGYAPFPLPSLERWLQRRRSILGGVLAVGGQQKNAVALWTGSQAILGPHFGDLDGIRSRKAWPRHVADLTRLYGMTIKSLVGDGHPDYFTTRWASEQKLPLIKAMHHHAHAATAMVEHDLLDRRVIALTWDGAGLGPDGTIWGGEILRTTLDDCRRIGTLRPIFLPGGDAAVRQPWRIGVSLLCDVGEPVNQPAWEIEPRRLRGVQQMILTETHCPRTTSLGRLFDGIASLILDKANVSYEAEAAAWLEAVADGPAGDAYPVDIEEVNGIRVWDWRPTVRALLADRAAGVPSPTMANRFHNSIVDWACATLKEADEIDVVLGGGCFQNALLTERLSLRLETIGKRVHRPGLIPANDGGLAAGQLAIGLARLTQSS